MNILIPHSWLKEHLITDANPEEIQRLVSLSGPSIERIYERAGESVYDVEVTTNRVDVMSVRGMAREAAVILQANNVRAKLKPLSMTKPSPPAKTLPLPEIRNTAQWCSRIMCVVLDAVDRTKTPKTMAKRLQQIEQNVHDAVIDITNYVTHEYGHPIHAFDYDKIMALGGIIRVVEATAGKTFTTLDGAEYKTFGGEIVFENDKGEIIDLPAIKGTLNSAVDDSTKRILLWVESLDAKKVRSASMKHAIRTVAAQLNEKNVDPNLAQVTLFKAVEMYESLTSARVASKVYDEFRRVDEQKPIYTSFHQIEAYLGLSLLPTEVKHILTNLECEVAIEKDGVKVIPPTFRSDIRIPADVVEEIARIYGYHRLPSKLMSGEIPTQQPQGINLRAENQAIRLLSALGAQEVYTYSLVSEALAKMSGNPLEKHLAVRNPLTEDNIYLRRSLIPSLNEVLDHNPTRTELTVFELANVFHPKQGTKLPNEERHLSLATRLGVPVARAFLDRLLKDFYISVSSIDRGGVIKARATSGKMWEVGQISHTSKSTIVDLLWSAVMDLASNYPRYQPIPKSAPLLEDFTFELPEKTNVGPVIATIKSASDLIAKVVLVSTFKNRKSFRATFQDPVGSLSTEVIAPLRDAIIKRVEKEHGGTLAVV